MYKSGYRKLLKIAQSVFRNDSFALSHARNALREEFYKNKDVHDAFALKECANNIEDVHHMLKYNIVQGKRNASGQFDVAFNEDHHETIAAGQHLQHGPELEPIDPSYVGKDVVINKGGGVSKKGEPFVPIKP